jgi:GntR family transcriptional regulator
MKARKRTIYMIKRVKQRPLYLQAKEEIRKFIDESGLKNGDLLPPEGSLCERLGISRGTLREAMRALEEEELVVRKQGIGTYVTHNELLISSTLDLNEGVTEMIRGKGMVPGSRNICIEEIKANRKIGGALGLNNGDTVFLIKRVRTANDVPVAYTQDFIPTKIIPEKILEQLGEGSLYSLIENRLIFNWHRVSLDLSQSKPQKPWRWNLTLNREIYWFSFNKPTPVRPVCRFFTLKNILFHSVSSLSCSGDKGADTRKHFGIKAIPRGNSGR